MKVRRADSFTLWTLKKKTRKKMGPWKKFISVVIFGSFLIFRDTTSTMAAQISWGVEGSGNRGPGTGTGTGTGPDV